MFLGGGNNEGKAGAIITRKILAKKSKMNEINKRHATINERLHLH